MIIQDPSRQGYKAALATLLLEAFSPQPRVLQLEEVALQL